ncbi:GIY-YIG nuclease family protein [Flavobacterium pectinovorum]|uniref:GIY-YIG nuclease family protein n=1 Tax=Flavobacterium pectinovorum TaxID=29533 RepID=A0A502F6J9_9FLAO|nr:GIY-YIG nuclease family protein [Flavobacterium pectinovorum]TPG44501.1 GIY-YIG nuclease family protein [Flavobacterium pectinovorum]
MYVVYILHSSKLNRYYIGFTSDFDTRMEFHKNAESNKFTANAQDWKLFLKVGCETKTQGLDIEKHIKKMKSKIYIENLIKYPDIVFKLKEKYK